MSGRFLVAGLVHPTEYDWKWQMDQVKRDVKRFPSMFMELDAGKVLGLAEYIEELEEQRDLLMEACKKANTCASLPDYVKELVRAAIATGTAPARDRGDNDRS